MNKFTLFINKVENPLHKHISNQSSHHGSTTLILHLHINLVNFYLFTHLHVFDSPFPRLFNLISLLLGV